MTPKDPNPLDSLRSEGDLNLSPKRKEWADKHIDLDTQRILDQDSKYFLHQSLSTPCLNVLTGCKGATLIDNQWREILDFHGNNVHQVGFGHPKVIEAIKQQLDELPFCTRRYTNEKSIALAKKLTELAPGDLNKVLFAPGGAEAMGMAIKLARLKTGRHKTISMWDSFHGATLDAISIGGEAIFRKGIGPLLPGCEHVPPPNPVDCPFECGTECNLKCANYIEYVLEKEGDVAAVIGETMRSIPYVPPRDYWKTVREACDRHGALLVLDEIPTGLGRSGKMFVCEHYEVVPDMLVIGKGLGGGVFPLAALLAQEDLDIGGETALGHYTHEKSPVGAAAALATLEVIEEEGLLDRAAELGAYFKNGLIDLQRSHPCLGEVRGLGLFLGATLVQVDNPTQPDPRRAEAVMYESLSRGLSFKTTMGNTLTLTPPLTVLESEIDRALEILDASLAVT
ncbi:MAG: aspartate aminotransferase family protein [Candidatus Omnitrophica bacterium]|nr:aspartate aminotransferase family protein [Candidatus Omnitrophota bacterium]